MAVTWKCDLCGATVRTAVPLVDPQNGKPNGRPIHNCPKRPGTHVVYLTEVRP